MKTENSKKFVEIVKGIYLLKTPAGAVWSGIIFVDGRQKVLIDSGDSADNIDNLLLPALQELGYQLSDMDWLCNTHCHGDHIGGHHRIMHLGGVNVKVAAYERSLAKLKNPLEDSKKIRAVFPRYSAPAPEKLQGVAVNRVLKDGEMVTERLQVIAAPGHDDDCICFYDTETKTLISGDSLQGNGTSSQGTALCMDIDAYLETLKKLEAEDIVNIISAHPYLDTGSIALGRQESSRYLEQCREIIDHYETYIGEELKKGVDDPVQLAQGLIAFLGNEKPKWLFLPLYTVTSIMEHLQRTAKNKRRMNK